MNEAQKPEYWQGKAYTFFSHSDCESFPCHQTDDLDNFNCLFCYCPLYALGCDCGGRFTFTESGIKNCSDCLVPHKRDNYGYIIGKFNDIKQLINERESVGFSATEV
jgi:Zn-finger protein